MALAIVPNIFNTAPKIRTNTFIPREHEGVHVLETLYNFNY